MSKISDKIKEAKKQIELREKAKVVQKDKDKLNKLKENGKNYDITKSKKKRTPKPDIAIPKGYFLTKVPENLDDLTIGKLRTLHADIFGKEPPHDSAHNKVWIANKINIVLS